MRNIYFKGLKPLKSKQRTWRIISISLMLLVMTTSAVSAGGTNLQAVSRAPVLPVLNGGASEQAIPVETGALVKAVTGLGIEKSTNGADADTKPGVVVSAGDPITWTYVVSNSGSEVINDIVVTDDNGTPEDTSDDFVVCTIDKLTNQEIETCTQTGTAGVGPYGNIATAIGTPASGPDVSDTDPSHYLGSIDEPGIYIKKFTNGFDADNPTGPYLSEGEPVTWTYDVYNIGNTQLNSVVVIDDNGTPGDTSDDIEICNTPSLVLVGYLECSHSGTAAVGQYANVGTVTASPPGGLPDVSASDPSHYFGAGPAVVIEKHTNGQDADTAPGPYVPVGETVTWTYTFTNTGTVPLSDVTITDDNGTPGDLSDDLTICNVASLDPDASESCSDSGTASADQYTNLGTVTGTPPGGLPDVSDTDPSNYFGIQADINLEKFTNDLDADSAPGPHLPVGETINWTYIFTNTGNVALTSVTVTDDNGTPLDLSDDSTICTIALLDVDVSDSCSANGTAAAGQYTNLGTVTGTPAGGLPDVSDSDPSNYFGVSDPSQPSLMLQKYTYGLDADTAPGPAVPVGDTVTWTYSFTNTGNLTLFDVTVTDDNGTPGVPGDDVTVCTLAYLHPDVSDSCSDSGTASAGQYTNNGIVTGTPPGGLPEVSDSDPSNYFGVSDPPQPALTLQKFTYGLDADNAPGPSVPVGDTVNWTYTFTNTGNLTLFDVTVSDDSGTPGVPGDDVNVCTIPYLHPDVSDSCSDSGTASAGQYTNLGTVTGTPPGGLPDVSDSDPSNYFGISDPPQPALTLQKYTNGLDADTAPGVYIPVGETVSWTYTFTNTGNLTLFDVTITDDNSTPGDTGDDLTVCTIAYLHPNDSDSCSDSSTATAGQYTNVGTVTGTPPGGLTDVADSDPSNYFGVSDPPRPALALKKYTNGLDALSAPGPYIPVGDVVYWDYTVINIGTVPLSDVTVRDDNGTPGDPSDDFTVCTIASLDKYTFDTCSASDTAAAGQYANLGTATGTPPGGLDDVIATDPSHYFGTQPSINIEKLTNGQDADSAPGPSIPIGDEVTWKYTVSNNGSVPLSDIEVIDDQLGSICTIDTLDVGASTTCTATGTAILGQYKNVASVSAAPSGGLKDVQDEDSSHYLGYIPGPEIELQKSTNGFDADSAPGPTLYVGYNLIWEFTVSNPGDETLTDITIVDDNGTPDDDSDDVTVCTLKSLAPHDSHTCTLNGKVQHGQYANLGTVSGYLDEKLVSASDPSHYTGKILLHYFPLIFR